MTKSKQISVRLDDKQQEMLQQLLDQFNEQTIVNVAAADVMRIALQHLYDTKITTDDIYH